jgi:hypothetical protein
MYFNLSSSGPTTNIQSCQELEQEIKKNNVSRGKVDTLPEDTPTCVNDVLHCLTSSGYVCCEALVDVSCLSRACLCSDRPCEGHACGCTKPYGVCSSCLCKQLWGNSNELMRKRQQFRSHCALCKAEFCFIDVVLLPEVPTQPVVEEGVKEAKPASPNRGRGRGRGRGGNRGNRGGK